MSEHIEVLVTKEDVEKESVRWQMKSIVPTQEKACI